MNGATPSAGQPARPAPEPSADEPSRGTHSVRRSLLLSFADRYLRLILQIGSTAILARLLSPEDYGVYTIGTVIIGIAGVLRDFGVLTYLIQEKHLTSLIVRTAYGISLLIGSIAAVAIALLSGFIGAFYGNDGVREVLLVLAINFVLMPFGSIVLMLLRREMNFAALLRINVSGMVVNATVAIVLAVLGDSFMSLAWGTLAGSASTCVLAAWMRPHEFSMMPSLKEWRRLLSFGVVASAGILVNEIGIEAPQLIIGRFLGVEALGIYGRADSLLTVFARMVTNAVAPVAVSAFAMQHRAGAEMKGDFLRATTMMTGLAWPFFASVGLVAYPTVRILFGANWDAAVPIVQILSVSGGILSLANLNWFVFQAKGAVRTNLVVQLIVQPVAIVLVATASQFSLALVAMAVVTSSIVSVVVSYHFMNRLIGTNLGEVLAAAGKSLAVTAAASAVPVVVLITVRIDAEHIWLPFMLAFSGAGAGYLLGLASFSHPLFAEFKIMLRSVRFLPTPRKR